MIQLQPGENFIITRQLDNPADTNTYYIKAYIRNATTDELLTTVNLTNKGDQRFRGDYSVPQIIGLQITITTKVYTNSGYTTESEDYGRLENHYLIQQRWSMALGGGGGASINYKKIQEMIREEIKKIELPEPKIITNTIKGQEIDLKPIVELLKEADNKINNLKPAKETDISPIVKELKKLSDKILEIKMPEIDFNPVIKEINNLTENIIKKNETIEDAFSSIKNRKFIELKVMPRKEKTESRKVFI